MFFFGFAGFLKLVFYLHQGIFQNWTENVEITKRLTYNAIIGVNVGQNNKTCPAFNLPRIKNSVKIKVCRINATSSNDTAPHVVIGTRQSGDTAVKQSNDWMIFTPYSDFFIEKSLKIVAWELCLLKRPLIEKLEKINPVLLEGGSSCCC